MVHQSRGSKFWQRSVANREDHSCSSVTGISSKDGLSVGSPIYKLLQGCTATGEGEISPPWGPGAWAGHRYQLRSSQGAHQVGIPQRKRTCPLRCCQSRPRRWPAGRWPPCPGTDRSQARPSQSALSLHRCIPFCKTSAVLWVNTLQHSSPSGPGLQRCLCMHNAMPGIGLPAEHQKPCMQAGCDATWISWRILLLSWRML